MSTDPRASSPERGSARPGSRPAGWLAMLCLGLLAGTVPAQGTEPERTAAGAILFRHVLDDEPIAFTYRADQEITPAVEAFHQTAENPYVGDPAAIEAGQQLFAKLCQACHMPDGTGRIGPNLVDERWRRPRTDTDIGRFEIIYAGGAGAMQSFGRHIDQDQILRVMAYLKVLRESSSD